MMRRQRFSIVRPRSALLLLALATLAGCYQRGTTEPILIGHVATLSGSEKTVGEHAKRGILLAVEEANQEDNRIAGRRVAVLHADARPDGKAAQAEGVGVRLISINKVAALLGGTDAAQAEYLARAVQSGGVPLVTQSGLPGSSLNENVFSCSVAPARQGQVLAKYAARELKAGRVAVLSDNRSSASTALADAFVAELGRDNATWLEFKGPADFADVVGRARKANPRAILIAGAASNLGKLRAELAKAGLEVPVWFGGDEGSLPALQADREASNGVYLATPYLVENDTPANREFVKAYKERFQESPDVHAALAYDGARLLFEAMRRAKTPTTPPGILEELSKLEGFPGLTGPLSFGNDRHARRPVFVVRLQDGRVEKVSGEW